MWLHTVKAYVRSIHSLNKPLSRTSAHCPLDRLFRVRQHCMSASMHLTATSRRCHHTFSQTLRATRPRRIHISRRHIHKIYKAEDQLLAPQDQRLSYSTEVKPIAKENPRQTNFITTLGIGLVINAVILELAHDNDQGPPSLQHARSSAKDLGVVGPIL